MLLYWIVLPVAWVLVHLLFRFEVLGKEYFKQEYDGRALVIAPNHISSLDPVFLVVATMPWRRRTRFLAKEELFKNPFVGWFLRRMGGVSIERGHGDTRTVEKLTENCRKGTPIAVFPEGTRTKTGKLGMLKSGAFVIASTAGADLLPCRIIYDTKDGKMHFFCRMRVCFGPAIPAAELAVEDPTRRIAALRRMKKRLQGALEALYLQHRYTDVPDVTGLTDPQPETPPKAKPAAPAQALPAAQEPAEQETALPQAPASPTLDAPDLTLDPAAASSDAPPAVSSAVPSAQGE